MRNKSRQSRCKIRNLDESVTMGWTICKPGDIGENGGSFVFSHLVKYVEHTYTNLANGMNYNIIWLLVDTGDISGSGRTLVMDSAYPTIALFRDWV